MQESQKAAPEWEVRNKMVMKVPTVKNQSPAPIQITAEQILIDAQIHKQQTVKPSTRRIVDDDELDA